MLMPVPKPPDEIDAKSGFLASSLVVTMIVAFSLVSAYWLFDQSGRSAALVKHTLDVKRAANEVLTLTVDAETGQRGFLLTGEKDFLEPYDNAKKAIYDKVGVLQELTSDNPRQSRVLGQIKPLIDERMTRLQESIERAGTGDRETSIAVLRARRGKEIQDQVRAGIREVIDEEQRLLSIREADVERKRLLSLVPLLVALLGLAWLGWKETQRHQQQFKLLKDYNQRLDSLVRERTADLQRERGRAEALLRDVTHRVGNNLAMIAALLNIQRRRINDPRVVQALEEVSNRIQAMASAQRRMNLDVEADEVDGKPYLENLIADLRETVGEKKISIETDIAEIRLPGKDAVSYIILVNELVTNAIKHAFPGDGGGQVSVAMRRQETARGPEIVLTVSDDGIGSAAGEGEGLRKGLGKTVMGSLLQTLDGTLTREQVHPGQPRPGHRVIMRMPLGAGAQGEAAATEPDTGAATHAGPQKVA